MAKHLVNPIRGTTIPDAKQRIAQVLTYMQGCLCDAGNGLTHALRQNDWATELKRIPVVLKPNKPDDIGLDEGSSCNLIEVMNQVATMQRLFDALNWAETNGSGLHGFSVVKCHPTTSSEKKSEDDNDLVLRSADGKQTAHFEVSDVVGNRDGNSKLPKDLCSLRAIAKKNDGKPDKEAPGEWLDKQDCRKLLLVTSPKFGKRAIETFESGFLKLSRLHESGNGTWIIEVKPKQT